MKNQQGGFTIMELIVVISIISVLFTLGATTYRRATYRAKNTQKIVNLKEAAKVVSAYVIENGTLPDDLENVRNNGGVFVACLGKTTLDTDSDGLSNCDSTSTPYEEIESFNASLTAAGGTIPLVDDSGVDFGSLGRFWGGTLVYFDTSSDVTVNGALRRLWLNYALLGPSQRCEPFGGEVVTSGTPPNWLASGDTTGLQVNGNTVCYIALTQEFGR